VIDVVPSAMPAFNAFVVLLAHRAVKAPICFFSFQGIHLFFFLKKKDPSSRALALNDVFGCEASGPTKALQASLQSPHSPLKREIMQLTSPQPLKKPRTPEDGETGWGESVETRRAAGHEVCEA
jgi:hypothetical protein